MYNRRISEFAKKIPEVIRIGSHVQECKTTEDLHFYGYYEHTGWKKFFRKVNLGIKEYVNRSQG